MQYSTISGAVTWSGGTTMLGRGQSIDDEHPLLAERPDLFSEDQPAALISTPSRVQSAMARPGEARAERGTPPTVVTAPPRKTPGQ